MEGTNGDKSNSKYFSVYVPPEDQAKSNDCSCIVNNFKDAAGILARNPGARFRTSSTEEDAWEALEGDSAFKSPVNAATPLKTNAAKNVGAVRRRLSLPAMNNSPAPPSSNALTKKLVGEEKDTRFPTPRIQELTAMAREIRMKNNDAVIARVEKNPKILVNDCDRPTTVQEGCRYNALHVAATCNNAQIIAYILNKVGSRQFMETLYPAKSADGINDQIRFVTDAYLNTPDKMFNETPLHFACKFMSVQAAEVLLHHPWIKLDAANNCDKTAFEIIASRADTKALTFTEKKRKLDHLFTEFYIVPIWRDSVGLCMARVGPVAHIGKLGEEIPMCLLKEFPDFDVHLLETCDEKLKPESNSRLFKSPGGFEEEGSWEIKAFAGPTIKDTADELLVLMKGSRVACSNDSLTEFDDSPPRDGKNCDIKPSTPTSSLTPRNRGTTRKSWSFANSPRSPLFRQSLQILSPLKTSPFAHEESKQQRLTDSEKGMERFCRNIAVDCDVRWHEYWQCLEFFGDIASDDGLLKLEQRLQSFNVSDDLSDSDSDNEVFSTPPTTPNWKNWRITNCATCMLPGKFCQCDDPLMAFQFLSISETDLDENTYFINGELQPGKHDFKIFAVLKDYKNHISKENFPRVFQWLQSMLKRSKLF